MGSLADICQQFRRTYRDRNAQQFAGHSMPPHFLMSLEILRRTAGLLEARRKENWQAYNRILAELLVWIIGIFELGNFSLEDEMFRRYPGCCPYCSQVPCSCDIHNKGVRRSFPSLAGIQGLTVNSWQQMLREIYPNSGMSDQTAADKIVEEIAEMATAARENDQIDKFLEEAVDAVARLFAAANQQEVWLGDIIEKLYPNGCCCACGHSPCNCPDSVISSNYRPASPSDSPPCPA